MGSSVDTAPVGLGLRAEGTLRAAVEALATAELHASRDRPYGAPVRACFAEVHQAILTLFKPGSPVEALARRERLLAVAASPKVLRVIAESETAREVVRAAVEAVRTHCERWTGLPLSRPLESAEDLSDLARLVRYLNSGVADREPEKFSRELAKWVR